MKGGYVQNKPLEKKQQTQQQDDDFMKMIMLSQQDESLDSDAPVQDQQSNSDKLNDPLQQSSNTIIQLLPANILYDISGHVSKVVLKKRRASGGEGSGKK